MTTVPESRGTGRPVPDHPTSALEPGTTAPDFNLNSTPDQSVGLADFRGHVLIMAFYPADWSPVCGDQMALYNEILPEFRRLGAELLGISVDGAWCHAAFAHERNLRFPLLADFEPKGEVAQRVRRLRRRRSASRAGAVRHRRGGRRSAGATSRRSASTPAPTASSRRWSRWLPRRSAGMSDATRHDHAHRPGRASATTCPGPRRAGHARRVRRLRVPVLRRGAPRSCKQLAARARGRPAVRLPPLPAHPDPPARLAAPPQAAEAAGAQGKFWEMHDLLFENQQILGHADLVGLRAHARRSTSTASTRDLEQRDATRRGSARTS